MLYNSPGFDFQSGQVWRSLQHTGWPKQQCVCSWLAGVGCVELKGTDVACYCKHNTSSSVDHILFCGPNPVLWTPSCSVDHILFCGPHSASCGSLCMNSASEDKNNVFCFVYLFYKDGLISFASTILANEWVRILQWNKHINISKIPASIILKAA